MIGEKLVDIIAWIKVLHMKRIKYSVWFHKYVFLMKSVLLLISCECSFSKFLVNSPFDYKVYHKMCPVNSWKNILASDMLLHLCMSLFQLWNEITIKSNLGSLNLCFFFLLCYFLCLAWSFCIWHFTGLSSTRAPRVNWTGDFTHFKHRL